MQTQSPEELASLMLQDPQNFGPSNSGEPILNVLFKCAAPWSSKLSKAVLSWLGSYLIPDPKTLYLFPSYQYHHREFSYLLGSIAERIPDDLLVETLVVTRKILEKNLADMEQADPATLPDGWRDQYIPGCLRESIRTIDQLVEGDYFFSRIEELKAAGASSRELEEKGFSLIKFAAYTGNIDLLETELQTRPPQEVIQRCFELAADNRHIEAATRLVKAGAECNYNHYILNDSSYIRCPFCYHPDTMEDETTHCEHLVSLYYEDDDKPDGYYIDCHPTYNITTIAYEIGLIVERLNEKVFVEFLEQAPSEIKPILGQVRTHVKECQAGKVTTVCLKYSVNNMWGDWYDLYFRPGPPITENQAATLNEWLTQQA